MSREQGWDCALGHVSPAEALFRSDSGVTQDW